MTGMLMGIAIVPFIDPRNCAAIEDGINPGPPGLILYADEAFLQYLHERKLRG